MSGGLPVKKRDLLRSPSRAQGVEITLFPWHLEKLDAWAAEQGISRSEMVRQMIRERDREKADAGKGGRGDGGDGKATGN